MRESYSFSMSFMSAFVIYTRNNKANRDTIIIKTIQYQCILFPPLPAQCIFIIEKGGVDGLLTQNSCHILVERLAHLSAGNCARVHNIMRYPNKVYASLSSLILEQAMQTADILARHMVIHNNDVHIELLAHFPTFIQQVDIAAVCVGAHHHFLIAAHKILKRLFLIAYGDWKIA